MTARMVGVWVVVAMASGCSGKKDDASAKSKEPPPAPTENGPPPMPGPEPMTPQSCLALTASILKLPADVAPYKDREVSKDDNARTVQTVAAEVFTLRGHPGDVCVTSAKRDSFPCSEEDPACADPEEMESTTNYVVAVVTDGKITDRRTATREYSENTTEGELSVQAIGLGSSFDGLLLVAANESGDASTKRTTWLTIADGKFVEHMSYKTGIDDGDFAGRVSHKVLPTEVASHATIELSVTREDGEPPTTDTCTWHPATGLYKCDKNLIEDM